MTLQGDIQISGTDTSLEGAIETFDSAKRLVEVANYHDNKIQGKRVIYYSNGKPKQQSYYTSGQKAGKTTVYDSLGMVLEKVHFWNDRPLGSEELYKNGSLETYRFVSFEGIPLYRVRYNDPAGLKETGSPLFYVSNFAQDAENGQTQIEVFLFLMNPPDRRLTYRLFDTDTVRKDTTYLETIKADSAQEFADFYLKLPVKDHKYFFEIEAFYPRIGVTVKNILRPDELDLIMPQ